MHLVEHGWFWSIPLNDGVTSIGFVGNQPAFKQRQGGIEALFDAQLTASTTLAGRLANAERITEVMSAGNYSYRASTNWGDGYMMSGEDLTIQAGLAIQQDLALVSLLGLTHVERNGHHYVNGMASLAESEQAAFLIAHPDLYERSHGAVRVAIKDGMLRIGSLACKGFASAAMPDWDSMRQMETGRGKA